MRIIEIHAKESMNLHAVEHGKQRGKGQTDSKHRLHLDHGQVAIVRLELFLLSFQFFLLLLIARLAEGFLLFLHCKYTKRV